jgi:hypothetical protein
VESISSSAQASGNDPLETELQPKLYLSGRAETIHSCPDSNPIHIVPRGSRSVDLSRGTCQQAVERGTGQVEIGKVEQVVKASTRLERDPFLKRVRPSNFQIQSP